MKATVVWFTLLLGVVLLVMVWMVTCSCRAERTFKEVWKIREMEHSQEAAYGDIMDEGYE